MIEWFVDLMLSPDEYGRPLLTTAFLSVVFSASRGILTAGFVIALGLLITAIIESSDNRFSATIIRVFVDALESVPSFIWVLAAISAIGKGGFAVVTAVFAVATLPLVLGFLGDVIKTIMGQQYVFAALSMGQGRWRVFCRHVLPNTLLECWPLFFYLSGSAIAIYGAVGIFGFVNRSEMDLGVMLLRGKEMAAVDLTILVVSIICYLVLFIVMKWIHVISKKGR